MSPGARAAIVYWQRDGEIDDHSTADEESHPEMFEGPHANFTTPRRTVGELARAQIACLIDVPQAKIDEREQTDEDRETIKRAVDDWLGLE